MIEHPIRMLAAIMFTDIVGYTALMQENEQFAKNLRDKHRNVLEEVTLMHKGRILQYYGDGTLSIFGSVIEAVTCAIEIQCRLQNEPKVPLRIGIHLGDIVYEDDGVYGDGVNIAARIESLSVPGGILISDKVYDEIKNHPQIPVKSLGFFELKNVKRAVEIFAIASKGIPVPSENDIQADHVSARKSIAVLPFVNMSHDPENEYFSDGIAEELINALTKVDGLHVTSRTSSFAFKGKNDDIRLIGEKLNVNSLLEGSVRKAGNRVRITAQLINTADGYHMWSETYDRNIEDIFAVQDEISKKIANKLREKLNINDKKNPLVKSYTENIDAYHKYLKAKFYWNKWNPESARKAINYLNEAIEMEPDFPLSYAKLSNCYVFLGAMGFMKTDIAYPKAKELALKALELDDTICESHLSLAAVELFYEWNWKKANKTFLRAMELNPGSAEVYHTYSLYLLAMGEFEKNLLNIQKAYRLDPLSLPINDSLGQAYFSLKRFNDAIRQYKRTLELDPNFLSAQINLGWAYIFNKEYSKAIEIFKNLNSDTGKLKKATTLGVSYAYAGEREEALKYLEILHQKISDDTPLSIDLAVVYMALKDYDNAFYYLNEAYEKRLGGMIFLKQVYWQDLQNDSRFKDLLNKMEL